jgi:hypothetical protein
MPGQAAGGSPGFIAPMLATAAAGLPADAVEFVAEVKWDGLRACVAMPPEPGQALACPLSIPRSNRKLHAPLDTVNKEESFCTGTMSSMRARWKRAERAFMPR